jgi:hypothetical protein
MTISEVPELAARGAMWEKPYASENRAPPTHPAIELGGRILKPEKVPGV